MRGGRVPPHRSGGAPKTSSQLEIVDAPPHAGDLERYPARGYAMRGNRIAVVTGRREDLVEVHPPSRGTVDLGGLSVERGPPAPLPAGWWGRHRAAPVPPTSSVAPNPFFSPGDPVAGRRRVGRDRDGRPRPPAASGLREALRRHSAAGG